MSKIKNQAIVDLRFFNAKALKKIKSITNCAVVYLPENPGVEFMDAYSEIKKTRIAKELYLPTDADINNFNGINVITKNDIQKNSFVMANGVTVLKDIPEDWNVRMFSNGVTIIAKDVSVNFVSCNGLEHKVPLSDFPAKISTTDMLIDSEALKYLEQDTVIVSSGNIEICDDVQIPQLEEKNITIVATGDIYAPKEMHSYLSVKAVCTGDIEEK